MVVFVFLQEAATGDGGTQYCTVGRCKVDGWGAKVLEDDKN